MDDERADLRSSARATPRMRFLLGLGLAAAAVALLHVASKAFRGPRTGTIPLQCQVLTLPGNEPDIETLLRRLSSGLHSIDPGEAHLHALTPRGRIRLDGRRVYEFHIGAPPDELTAIEVTEPDGSSRLVAVPGHGTDVPFRIDVPFWGIHTYVLEVRTVHGDFRPLPLRLRGNVTADQLRLW